MLNSFNPNQINSCCINSNQYIPKKIKNKLCMKATNYACFKLEGKAMRDVKNNKSNFIIVIGDKFVMSIK